MSDTGSGSPHMHRIGAIQDLHIDLIRQFKDLDRFAQENLLNQIANDFAGYGRDAAEKLFQREGGWVKESDRDND